MLIVALGAAVALVAAEIYVIVLIAHAIGLAATLLALLGCSAAGLWLVRGQRRRAWGALREAVADGAMPGRELADAALVLTGSVLVAVPGFITDALGVLMVATPSRRVLRRLVGTIALRAAARGAGAWARPAAAAWAPGRFRRAARPGARGQADAVTVIQGEVIRDADPDGGGAGARPGTADRPAGDD